jgi:hypothetical protein
LWDAHPWLYGEILTPTVMFLGLLVLPLVITFLRNLVDDQELKSIKETFYESYLSFFFLDSDTPRSIPAKLLDLSYSLFVLIFLSFYLGTMTKEYFDYKSLGGIKTLNDIIGKKIQTNLDEKYMMLSLGGNNSIVIGYNF